jgi:hypothetical protein
MITGGINITNSCHADLLTKNTIQAPEKPNSTKGSPQEERIWLGPKKRVQEGQESSPQKQPPKNWKILETQSNTALSWYQIPSRILKTSSKVMEMDGDWIRSSSNKALIVRNHGWNCLGILQEWCDDEREMAVRKKTKVPDISNPRVLHKQNHYNKNSNPMFLLVQRQ